MTTDKKIEFLVQIASGILAGNPNITDETILAELAGDYLSALIEEAQNFSIPQ